MQPAAAPETLSRLDERIAAAEPLRARARSSRSLQVDAEFDQTFHLLIERPSDPVPVVPEAIRRVCVAVGKRTAEPFFVATNETDVYFALLTPDPKPFEPNFVLRPKPEDLAADLERLRLVVAAIEALARAA